MSATGHDAGRWITAIVLLDAIAHGRGDPIPLEAEILEDESWNGFVYPRFGQGVADVIVRAFPWDPETESDTLRWRGAGVEVRDGTTGDTYLIDPDGDGMYEIGGGS